MNHFSIFGVALIQVVGWDIGGANVKAACIALRGDDAAQVRVATRPFEIWHEKDRLPSVLREIYSQIAIDKRPRALAVTMTAELSDIFSTKREGVIFVLDSIGTCFPDLTSYALSLSGEFVLLRDAIDHPLDFAATNWLALSKWIAGKFSSCLLVDVGSTTTDILPIYDGRVCVSGRTDMERLSSGELVFSGALRTNLAAIVQSVPVAGNYCRVASEYFCISGDVHLILGHLLPEDYTCSTPDRQEPSVDSARRRLARLVCADTEMLSESEIDAMAHYINEKQIGQICEGMEQVLARMPPLRKQPVVALGVGSFLGSAAAKYLGLQTIDLETYWKREELAAAPSLAAAHLLAEFLKTHRP